MSFKEERYVKDDCLFTLTKEGKWWFVDCWKGVNHTDNHWNMQYLDEDRARNEFERWRK